VSLAHTLQSVRSIVLALAVIVCGLAGRIDAQQTGSYRTSSPSSERVVEVLSHDLNIELHPNRHQLDVLDRMTFKALVSSPASLSLVLNDALQVADIRLVNDKGAPLAITTRSEAAHSEESAQRITITLDDSIAAGHVFVLEWTYHGLINDPPREPRHLRFVTPSETSGYIGPEGVYLSGETYWYPHLEKALPVFHVHVTTPIGWSAVTHGRQLSQTIQEGKTVADWEIVAKTEALTLVANRFIKAQQDWQGIEIATYLFAEDAPLAQEYLDASVRYLDTYTKLLGPYPFPKFAVVENFFASGLGMPSFTLLGSGVIKRHYIQPYALGHEIVHSWIGNWVLNRSEQGNWVEGLTTYVANYYYEELMGTPEQALDQRRLMTYGYALYVRPEEDYPVGRFTHKSDQKDNAIGYQKAAMIFHMLRREIGNEAFWNGLTHLVREYGEGYADWRDVEQVFSRVGRMDLRWFFAQWVDRAGAPGITVQHAQVKQFKPRDGGLALDLRVSQEGRPFRMSLPIRVGMSAGRTMVVWISLDAAEQAVTVAVPAQPVRVEIDPDFEIFRRLERTDIPPMLNLYVTDRTRSVVLPTQGTDAHRAPYRELAARMSMQDQGKPLSIQADDEGDLAGSILVLGGPGVNRRAEWAVSGCRDRISLKEDRVSIEEQSFQGSDVAVLISCPHPEHPDRVITLFYGMSPSASAKVGRLLFFYGWQSYLVFRDGKVVARGNFSSPHSSLKVAL